MTQNRRGEIRSAVGSFWEGFDNPNPTAMVIGRAISVVAFKLLTGFLLGVGFMAAVIVFGASG